MPEKFVCDAEDCEMEHCRRCGRHYHAGEAERPGECPRCTVGRAASEAEARTRAFGGDYEAAGAYSGW